MVSQFFYKDETGKCRVRRDGSTTKNEPWYIVEWKPNDLETPWQWYLCGTASWLNLTEQEIEWAEPKAKAK